MQATLNPGESGVSLQKCLPMLARGHRRRS